MTKLEWLRTQAEAYWRDAEAAATEEEAWRLAELAIRCQEQILEIQYGAPGRAILN
jgi:hypothetical protein